MKSEAKVLKGRHYGWVVVVLLFFVQMINFMDKAVVGLAARPIMQELGLSNQQYGVIASSFFSLYAATGLFVAFFIAPKVRPRKILAVLLVIWFLVQLPIVFSATFPLLIACRALLGMGEGAGTPTAINACHEWFDSEDRNMPTAVLLFGTTVGSLIAAPVLSYFIDVHGWRSAFLVCGVLGFCVFLLWVLLSRDGPHSAFKQHHEAVSHNIVFSEIEKKYIWTDRTVIGNLVVGFSAYWVIGFMVSWLAPFISTVLGFGIVTTGWILSIVYLVHAIILLTISYISQQFLKSGKGSRIARGNMMGYCLLGCAVSFGIAALVTEPIMRVVFVGFATGLVLPIFSLSPAMISEITPINHRNQLMTVILALVTLAAIPSPLITGWVVDAAGDELGWSYACAINVIVPLFGGIAAFILLRPKRSMQRFRSLAEEIPVGVS